MEESFDSMEELIENISMGGEVEFEYNGKQYSITHIPEGVVVLQAYRYSTQKIYKNAFEIIEYKINGKKISEIIDDIKITFRCF